MTTYPRWLTLGQTERMDQLQAKGWRFGVGKNPDKRLVIHGVRGRNQLTEDTLVLWKDPRTIAMLSRWPLGEGPHRRPEKNPPDEPLRHGSGTTDEVLTEALKWITEEEKADES